MRGVKIDGREIRIQYAEKAAIKTFAQRKRKKPNRRF